MTPSIRTFLLINLLLSVTLITSLAIIGNLFLAHQDIQTQLDGQLIRTSLRMKAFFSDRVHQHNLKTIQKSLNNAAITLQSYELKVTKSQANKRLRHAIEFQIWDKDGKLILHSIGAPKIPFSNGEIGLSNLWLNNHSWRVNTAYNSKNGITIMVAELANYRQELENQLTRDSILIMLITYPFLGFLIWVIVGRGLGTLKKVAQALRHRAPDHLEPVALESVPAEIAPLVKELNSLFNRLKKAFEREKRFTADAAHELKTPLAALSTQTQVALRADTPESRNQALLKVLAGVNRSTHVVQQLLTLSRMDPEAKINDPAPVKLAKLAADIAAQIAPEAIAKNIDLELLAPESKATILGNSTAISILLRNLVDNAVRYTQENSFVKLDIQEHDDIVSLRVIDNGPGIAEKLRKTVFERFYRVIGTQSTGSGLGLSIVQQIAKLHQATIQLLTPEHGSGLEVRIDFPRYK